MEFSEEMVNKIERHMLEKTKNKHCVKCNGGTRDLIHGYLRFNIHDNLYSEKVEGGPHIPTIGMICINCGDISFIAAKAIFPEL